MKNDQNWKGHSAVWDRHKTLYDLHSALFGQYFPPEAEDPLNLLALNFILFNLVYFFVSNPSLGYLGDSPPPVPPPPMVLARVRFRHTGRGATTKGAKLDQAAWVYFASKTGTTTIQSTFPEGGQVQVNKPGTTAQESQRHRGRRYN